MECLLIVGFVLQSTVPLESGVREFCFPPLPALENPHKPGCSNLGGERVLSRGVFGSTWRASWERLGVMRHDVQTMSEIEFPRKLSRSRGRWHTRSLENFDSKHEIQSEAKCKGLCESQGEVHCQI